jgi:holo-[acyl-carrier protein] synthase
MALLGLGIDVCSVDRMRRVLAGPRGTRFLERVFTPEEQQTCLARADGASAFAARFAAKEALVKALGAPPGVRWRDMEVVRGASAPSFRLQGVAAEVVVRLRARVWLSLTHDAGVAAAAVVLEETT